MSTTSDISSLFLFCPFNLATYPHPSNPDGYDVRPSSLSIALPISATYPHPTITSTMSDLSFPLISATYPHPSTPYLNIYNVGPFISILPFNLRYLPSP